MAPGKTSVLEAINYAMSPSFLSGRIHEEDFNNEDIDCIDILLCLDPCKSASQTDTASGKFPVTEFNLDL